jgi:hypothetical protein
MSLELFFIIFFVNIIIEAVLGYLILKNFKAVAIIILANVITHPILSYLFWLNNDFQIFSELLFLIIMEYLVIIAEAAILTYGFKQRDQFKYYLLVSCTLNFVSFSLGLIFLG